ncbi:hypothetical protein Tco_0413582 [Tanacetum coccineum]
MDREVKSLKPSRMPFVKSDAWTVCGYYMLCATCSGYGTLQGFVIKWSGFCGTLQGFVIKWSVCSMLSDQLDVLDLWYALDYMVFQFETQMMLGEGIEDLRIGL